jgi:hypothetical protein
MFPISLDAILSYFSGRNQRERSRMEEKRVQDSESAADTSSITGAKRPQELAIRTATGGGRESINEP